MKILAIDTTTFAGSIALLNEWELIGEVNINSPSTHSERLLPSVEFLLKMNKLSISEIDGYALTIGPGSFTGIRIGMATIKALSYASQKPVAPVSSLEALAFKLRERKGRLICPLLDAKKGEIYSALFESNNFSLKEVIAQDAYFPDKFFSLLPQKRIIYFIGNGVELYLQKIRTYFQDRAKFSLRSEFIAYEVGLLGYHILKNKQGVFSNQLKPLYLRLSEAEIKRQKTIPQEKKP
ncbi:MAG: tRNA (adenosine(37)-N6)-threonylcarbamoyltransferase complex dimerization subunit type 1 TsaB [Candidatus Aminicenantia bacterium]